MASTPVDKVIRWIESGKQVAATQRVEVDGAPRWWSVGVQKWEGQYKVSVDEVLESKMAADEYERDELVAFDSLDEALAFIADKTPAEVSALAPQKGQRVFDASQAPYKMDEQ